MKRTTRSQETRSANVRLPAGYRPPNAMPQDIDLGPDVKVRWVRKFINGAEEDKQSFFKRAQRGWVPVKPEEVPHLSYLKDGSGLIMHSGCVLCKIDRAVVEADVAYYEQIAAGYAEGAQSQFLNDSHEDMPKFSEGGKAKLFRGKLPNV